ncbi:Crp/Fnr family transcriptional regulator [candidate division KSB1 bacterium]
MKVINLKEKSLFDIARNISSILDGGVPKTTDDKNGFIIERQNQERTQYHQLVVKKFVEMKTKDISFNLEMEEGSLNPRTVKKTYNFKNIPAIEITFPNVMVGEEKIIKFKIKDVNGQEKEVDIKKDIYTTITEGYVEETKEQPKKVLKRFKQNAIIFNENDIGQEMYIIQKGNIGLFKKTDVDFIKLAEFGANSFFGEMALFGDPHRSATAKALENSDLLVITKEMFENQLKNVPGWFVTMFKAIIERLRDTDKMVDALKQRIVELEKTAEDKV